MQDDMEPFYTNVADMIDHVITITQEAVRELEPEVERVIKMKSRDAKLIESLLDRFLDYSLHCEEGLLLFKRLLRYYYPINPTAVAEYVYCYKDLTESLDEDSDLPETAEVK